MEQREHKKTYIITPLNGRVFMIIDGEQKEDVIHNLSSKHCKPLTTYGFIAINGFDEKTCSVRTGNVVDEVLPYINHIIRQAIIYVFRPEQVDMSWINELSDQQIDDLKKNMNDPNVTIF